MYKDQTNVCSEHQIHYGLFVGLKLPQWLAQFTMQDLPKVAEMCFK